MLLGQLPVSTVVRVAAGRGRCGWIWNAALTVESGSKRRGLASENPSRQAWVLRVSAVRPGSV
jgi:hypothetical protein